METKLKPKNASSVKDWHPATVIAELRIRCNLSLSQLAAQHGVTKTVLTRVLKRLSPLNERRIAKALGVHPMAIWPSRYTADGVSLTKRGAPGHKSRKT